MDKREQILEAIAAQERLRGTLDEQIIGATIAALQSQLDDLNRLQDQQRKQVTLLFMDIVGSSRIGLHLDPEDTMEVMDGAMKHLSQAVVNHGGRVTRYMGDGFKAVFGAPTAQENDPEMAVQSGLEIIEMAREYARQLNSDWGIEDFQVRVGINTGLVVLGGMTEGEDTIMGSTVNLAARMESSAPPGNLLISHNTFQHIRGLFDVEPLEPINVKGFDEPVAVYIVRRVKPRANRKLVRGLAGIQTDLFGRSAELQFLKDIYTAAQVQGNGSLVTIIGEAGIGKTRLLTEFLHWIGNTNPSTTVFFGQSSLEKQSTAYGVLRDLFISHFQDIEAAGSTSAKADIETGFRQIFGFDRSGEMRSHIIGQLLGFDFSSSVHVKGLLGDAQQLRNRALNYLVEYFQATSQRFPTLLVLEDIHWADDSSLEIIADIGPEVLRHPLVILCLTRERFFERRPAWGEGREDHAQLRLSPLAEDQSRSFVEQILHRVEDLPHDLRELIIQRSDGNPYYIEELIRMLISGGAINSSSENWVIEPEKLAQVEIPTTLMGVLQSRLESVPPAEKITLQEASVVGRYFWDKAVAYIDSHANQGKDGYEKIHSNILSLISRGMVSQHDHNESFDATEFSFRHSLLRDVTYESVLKKARRIYHRSVADWLMEGNEQHGQEQSALIAEHLDRAGEPERALPYLLEAGERAANQYAIDEAIRHYRKALDYLTDAALGIASDKTEIAAIHEKLGYLLAETGANKAARQQYRQAYDLTSKGANLPRSRRQRLIGKTYQEEGSYGEAEQSFDLAESLLADEMNQEQDSFWQEWIWLQLNRLDGYYARAETGEIINVINKVRPVVEQYGSAQQNAAFLSGQARMYFRRDRYIVTDELLDVSRKLLDISMVIDDKQRLSDAYFEFGFSSLWYGDLSRAEDLLKQSLQLAKECSNLYNQTLCNTYLAILYRQQRDFQNTRAFIDKSITTSTDRNMLNYLATAKGNQSWMALHYGRLDVSQQLGLEALDLWSQVPFVYPFQWTALWPLIAVAVEQGNPDQAVDYARALLAEDQQCLPDQVSSELLAVIEAWKMNNHVEMINYFKKALSLAGKYRFL